MVYLYLFSKSKAKIKLAHDRTPCLIFAFCKYITLYQYLLQYVPLGPNVSGASWQYSRVPFTDRRKSEYDIALA